MTDAIEIDIVEDIPTEESFSSKPDDSLWPTWVYVVLFFGPAAVTFSETDLTNLSVAPPTSKFTRHDHEHQRRS